MVQEAGRKEVAQVPEAQSGGKAGVRRRATGEDYDWEAALDALNELYRWGLKVIAVDENQRFEKYCVLQRAQAILIKHGRK